MPLDLRPITVHDTLAWTRIRALAYYGPLHVLVHSGPISEASVRGVAQDRRKEIGQPNSWQWKVVDTDLPPSDDDPDDNGGRTIAIAIWSVHNVPTQIHEHDENQSTGAGAKTDEPFIPPELKMDVLMAALGPLRAAQEEIMGTEVPYFKLDSLATHPDHQGKGAGKMLLQWGMRKADEEGLKCYLDATSKGLKLYERAGFRTVKEVTFDMSEWGGEGRDWWACMVREIGGTKS